MRFQKCFSLAPFRAGVEGYRPDRGATDLSNVSVPGGWVAGLGVSKSAGWFSPPECVSVVKTSLNAASGEVKSVEVVYLFFLNRGTVSSVVLGAGSGLMSVH